MPADLIYMLNVYLNKYSNIYLNKYSNIYLYRYTQIEGHKKAFAVFDFREGPLYTIITAIITTFINAAIVITNIKSTAL